MNDKVKIFSVYNKRAPVWDLPCVIPVYTGKGFWGAGKMFRDNTGDNIASQNKNFGELTAHYWVWKNYLKEHKPEYVGFCQYRRWFDFYDNIPKGVSFKPSSEKFVKNIIKQYDSQKIYESIAEYDVIVTEPTLFSKKMIDTCPVIKKDILLFASYQPIFLYSSIRFYTIFVL